ncbi:hypothetical protein [Ahniella affigens]|uniref:hypothetical protein n=1 Tax=Ahniella affigens TaxID=2021234 RepID=UPI001475DA3C|nr:hypothetical protein [Ahniella affigens]
MTRATKDRKPVKKLPTGSPLPSATHRGFAIDRRPLLNTTRSVIVWTVIHGSKEVVRDTAPDADAALDRAKAAIDKIWTDKHGGDHVAE